MKFSTCAALMAVLALTGCEQPKAKSAPPGTYAFDVMIKLSPKAEAAMKTSPDGFVVDAWYYGIAKPDYRDQADQLNRIFLGDEGWNFSANARKMHLHGEPIDIAKLSQTIDGQAMVNLTVESAAGHPGNPLNCHAFIGSIREAQKTTPVLACEFDTEQYWETEAESSAG
jgi:hypothetical protein